VKSLRSRNDFRVSCGGHVFVYRVGIQDIEDGKEICKDEIKLEKAKSALRVIVFVDLEVAVGKRGG